MAYGFRGRGVQITYGKIRAGADFDRCIDSIAHFAKETTAHPGGGPELRICAVLMKSNLREIPRSMLRASTLGASTFQVRAVPTRIRSKRISPRP